MFNTAVALVAEFTVRSEASVIPVPKLAAVEAELSAAGWKKIEAWAIGFAGLSNHLKNMAEDTP